MSNLFKSKFLLGAMIVAVMLVGAVAVKASTASAATCSITVTLRVGSKGDQVKCLQMAVGVTADGVFGPKTKAAVMAWQKSVGLTADGVFGPKSNAAWMSGGSTSMTYPAGCTSSSGYSPTTGMSCAGGGTSTSMTYPAGCTSSSGYSPTTGMSCAGGTMTSQTGPVQAMLSTDNPASAYIIANQATADILHVTFTGNGTVTSIVLQRGGVSDQNTLSNVYLYDGVTRLTDGYSFNNSGQLTMNGLSIVVNGSKTISVKADVANVSNASSLNMTLVSFTAGGTTVTVNVKGNDMTYGTGNLASVYLTTTNSVASPSVNAGTSSYTIWSATPQVNVRTVWLKGANFRIIGSAPANALANIKLYIDGVVAGNPATMGTINGTNYAMFDFSSTPVALTTGTHTVDLRADVVSGASYNVTVSIQQAADLVLYDNQVGVNVAITASGSAAYATNTSGTISINAGSASVVVDPVFQALTNITGGATNVVVARFKVHGYGEDVKVSTLGVTPLVASGTAGGCTTTALGATNTGTCGLNNVTVYFNGSQVGSSQNITSANMGSALSFSLGSQMILPAGIDSWIEIRADLQTSGSINYTAGSVSANLIIGASNAQGQTSHTTLNFPSGTITGTLLTVQTGVLAVSKNSGYANSNVNPNNANSKIGSFTLQNQSSSESVRVTSLAVNLFNDQGVTALTSSTTPALTNFQNLRTSETSGSGSTPIQPAATNTFSVDFTLPPGGVKTIDIFADTGATAGSAVVVTTLKVTSLGSSSNVSISQNGTGTAVVGQTITLASGTITNPPTLLSANSTSQQFVPASGGATNSTKATFNFAATGGAATVSELKLTVNSQDFSSAGTYAAITTGTGKVFTPTTGTDADRFAVGDSVIVAGATTNGIGTVTAITASTSVTIAITVAPVGGTNTTLKLVPSTVTSVTVNGVSAPVVSGVAYLTGLALQVPNGGSGLTQDVFISYAPVGTNGVTTGSTSRVALEYIKYTSGGTTTTMCTAALATCSPVIAAGGIAAPVMKLVGSAPTLNLAASGSTLVTGSVQVGSVVVGANVKGDITLNALPITVSLTNATLTSVAANQVVVQDANGNSVAVTDGGFSGSVSAPANDTITFTSGYKISAGTTQTFKIFLNFATVTNASGAHTSSASLTLGSADSFSWTDTAGNASATTGLDVAGSAATTKSNKFKDGLGGAATPGFFYSYPTITVSVSS